MFSRYKILCPALLTGLLSLILPLNSFAQAPVNDECGNATILTQNPLCTGYSGNTVGATVSPVFSAACEDNNTGDVWFSFTATDDSAVISVKNISATNANAAYYFFGIAAYSGTCGSLTEIGCNNGAHNTMNSSLMVGDMNLEIVLSGLTIGQTVYLKLWKDVALDNTLNLISNDLNFDICVYKVPSPPGCTTLISPADAATNVTIYPVVPVTFSWNAASGASSYSLYLDTVLTTPSENNTIAVYGTDATINNALKFSKTYYWYVTPVNAGGAATGCPANTRSFTTQAAPATPPNDLCAGAIPLVSGIAGLNQAATNDNSSLPVCGASSAGTFKGLWYSFTPNASGSLTIGLCDAQFDSYIRIYSGVCNSLACVALNDDGCPSSITGASSVTFPAIANQPYYALIGSWGNNSYGNFTINATGVALGVKMSSLAGEITENNFTRLSWETYSESNNQGFEIERSSNGVIFDRTDFVASQAKNGLSNEPLEHSYTDNTQVDGTVFYRITQSDFDGTKTVSNIVRLQARQNEFNVTITPNPAKDAIRIITSGVALSPASIHIYDLTGRLLRTINVTESEMLIDIKDMAQGSYLIQYTDAGHTHTFRINKQ